MCACTLSTEYTDKTINDKIDTRILKSKKYVKYIFSEFCEYAGLSRRAKKWSSSVNELQGKVQVLL